MDARSNRFLQDFSEFGRERLVGRLIYQELVQGEYLFREGDPAKGICLVLDGQVESVKTIPDGEKVLATFGPNEYLGEIAVLDGQGRSTDARAASPASVAWVLTADLLEVLTTEPGTLILQIFQNVLAILRRTNDLYVEEVVHQKKLTLIGEMADSLMHDLRNPLSGIRLASELISMVHTDEETTMSCERIRLQCDRVAGMAGELLEFSRGETKLHLERTDTHALMEQFAALNEDAFNQSEITLRIENEPAEIEVDSLRLQRVLQNLVANAVDSLKGRPDARIDIRSWVGDAVFHLAVRDNGPGIPPEIKDRLFEPFVTHGKTGGTGLGLAIVRNVVTAHRGKITVETQAGQGTEFLVRIPQDARAKAVG